jgi:hypothetical protein
MKNIQAKFYIVCFCILCGCNDRRTELYKFEPKNYVHVKEELVSRFGLPDTIIAFCNRDTSLLYRTKKGCVEWRLLKNSKLPYRVSYNDSCLIHEGEFLVFDYYPEDHLRLLKGFDANGWPTFLKIDTAITFTATGHWHNISFTVTDKDTGMEKILLQKIFSHNLGIKKSIRDKYCSRFGGDYILKFKLKDIEGNLYFGASNFPDTSYVSLLNTLVEADHYFCEKDKWREVE